MQGTLFPEAMVKQQMKELRKLPYDFYYRYVCDSPVGEIEHKHKIVDWEAGALFWKMYQEHGPLKWETKFREKIGNDLIKRNLMLLIENQHRFQHQWLIISLIYPPKKNSDEAMQASLF